MTKLSISNIAWKEEFDHRMYEYMSGNGFSGLEVAPTRIFPQKPYDRSADAAIYAQSLMSKYKISVSSMQSIWFGRTENIFGAEDERNILVAYTKKAVDFAGSLGCGNIVFGCPKNRVMGIGQKPTDASEFFVQIGNYARDRKIVIALEPNPALYGTNFINTTKEAFNFARELSCPGLMVNVDLGTVISGREPLQLIADNLEFVHHIHISEPELAPIQKRDLHGELSALLKGSDYKGYVSIEMKNTDNIGLVQETINYAREIFE
jgi:sugar phosphate isomerase/epimerase